LENQIDGVQGLNRTCLRALNVTEVTGGRWLGYPAHA